MELFHESAYHCSTLADRDEDSLYPREQFAIVVQIGGNQSFLLFVLFFSACDISRWIGVFLELRHGRHVDCLE